MSAPEAAGATARTTLPVGVSLAPPLALAYTVLIVYASLYPFSGWTDLGVPPFDFLKDGWPRYWLASDLIFNVLGYAPYGLLLAIAWRRVRPAVPAWAVMLCVTLAAATLSLGMETLQNYLPQRVSSNLDLGLNALGAWLGSVLALLLQRLGLLERGRQLRRRWFDRDSRGVLVLMAVWPAALLFPSAVPFGVGQVAERLSLALANGVQETPYADWLPLTRVELEPLPRLVQALGVGLGSLLPVLLGYSVVRAWRARLLLMPWVFVVGLGMLALSAALSYGPMHAGVWADATTLVGLVLGLAAALLLVGLPPRPCLLLLALALLLHLAIVNQAPTSPYLAQALQVWERGQFIHFHGLAQWVGWLWPYAVLLLVLRRLMRVLARPESPQALG